jgi:hypothetical protein
MSDQQPELRENAADIAASMVRKYEELSDATLAAINKVDAEYLFRVLIRTSMVRPVDAKPEATDDSVPSLIELGAFLLYPRFGLEGARDHELVEAALAALREQNMVRPLAAAFNVNHVENEFLDIQVHLRLHAEGVRGDAYPYQAQQRIQEVQGKFDQWFATKVNIGPLRAIKLVNTFQKTVEQNLTANQIKIGELQKQTEALMGKFDHLAPAPSTSDLVAFAAMDELFERTKDEALNVMAPTFSQLVQVEPSITWGDWCGLRELIGLTPDSCRKMKHAYEIKDRPVYYLSGDRFVYTHISAVWDALFNAFDQVTREHQEFRDKRYVPHLAGWVEERAKEYVKRLFPVDAVYSNLSYPDPDVPGGMAELDLAVLWGPFLILQESKGKQFRHRSRLGDPARLSDDLKDNLEEAFEQATRAKRFIESQHEVTLVEKGTNRKLLIRRDAVRRIFPVSVTLHHFAGLATQLAMLKKLNLFTGSNYPWSVALADLDIITKFATTPDVFLHYIQRRIELQESGKKIQGDELDVFGLYLDSRLHPSKFWERKTEDGKDFDFLTLSGGSDRFDAWYLSTHEGGPSHPPIQLNLPPNFLAVIKELRRRDDYAARWIAFALLGLSDGLIERIEKGLEQLRRTAIPDNRFKRVTFQENDLVVTLMACHSMSTNEINKNVSRRAQIEKYRFKTTTSLALGIDASDVMKPFEYACWVEGPWEQDAARDMFLLQEPLALGRREQRVNG